MICPLCGHNPESNVFAAQQGIIDILEEENIQMRATLQQHIDLVDSLKEKADQIVEKYKKVFDEYG